MAELGLPEVIIDFKTKSVSAIQRSARGIVAMLLKNESTNTSKFYKIVDSTDVPETELTAHNVDLVKKCLLGTPAKILLYTLPLDSVTIPEGEEPEARITQATILKQLAVVKWNYICHPTATAQEMTDLSTWIKSQRNVKRKTYKAVLANTPADDKGITNLTTGSIRVTNPDYTDALNLAGGDKTQVPQTIPQYITYTAAEYTARIAGILAGLALDRSATYYELAEVVDCEVYDDIDSNIDNGELCLFDELDGHGVKIARACNSLHTFTTDVGEDFRYIKIVEAVDMITDDIRDTFKSRYVGKIINDYDHKMLFIGAILVYFRGLKGNVLDNSETAVNTVDIDEAAQADYITLHGLDNPADLTVQQIREYNTGTKVYLTGRVTPVNAMEDLKVTFLM